MSRNAAAGSLACAFESGIRSRRFHRQADERWQGREGAIVRPRVGVTLRRMARARPPLARCRTHIPGGNYRTQKGVDMRFGTWRGVTLGLSLAVGLFVVAGSSARAQVHTIPRLVPAVDVNTGGPYYAPPIPAGHYTGHDLAGKVGLIHGKLATLGSACPTCGGLGHNGAGGACPTCGGGLGHGGGSGSNGCATCGGGPVANGGSQAASTGGCGHNHGATGGNCGQALGTASTGGCGHNYGAAGGNCGTASGGGNNAGCGHNHGATSGGCNHGPGVTCPNCAQGHGLARSPVRREWSDTCSVTTRSSGSTAPAARFR